MICADSAALSTPPVQGGDGGANPTPALQLSPRDLRHTRVCNARTSST